MDQVACLDDIEAIALRKLPRNALDYYRTGADDMVTLADNRNAFARYRTRTKLLLVQRAKIRK